MKKVLYLHGLNSKLHQDRREVLEKFNLEIFSPILDYKKEPDLLDNLIEDYQVDILIGSSAGGLVGYYFSGLTNIPALLFNPALPYRNYIKEVPTLPTRDKFLQIVLGARDIDVSAQETFEFLTQEFDSVVPMDIHWVNNLEHRIAIDIFEQELQFFLNKLK